MTDIHALIHAAVKDAAKRLPPPYWTRDGRVLPGQQALDDYLVEQSIGDSLPLLWDETGDFLELAHDVLPDGAWLSTRFIGWDLGRRTTNWDNSYRPKPWVTVLSTNAYFEDSYFSEADALAGHAELVCRLGGKPLAQTSGAPWG